MKHGVLFRVSSWRSSPFDFFENVSFLLSVKVKLAAPGSVFDSLVLSETRGLAYFLVFLNPPVGFDGVDGKLASRKDMNGLRMRNSWSFSLMG